MELNNSLSYALSMYFSYLGSGLALLMAFAVIYVKITPRDEIAMMREGKLSPTLSFGGALVGFSLTLASSGFHTNHIGIFVLWGILAGVVQMLVYFALNVFIRGLNLHIDQNNIAVGTFLAMVSIAVGFLNAGCLS